MVVQFERKAPLGGMSEYVACMSGYGILVCVYWYKEKRFIEREHLRMGRKCPVIYIYTTVYSYHGTALKLLEVVGPLSESPRYLLPGYGRWKDTDDIQIWAVITVIA